MNFDVNCDENLFTRSNLNCALDVDAYWNVSFDGDAADVLPGSTSRRRDCHSAAPPSPFSRCIIRDDEGEPVK